MAASRSGEFAHSVKGGIVAGIVGGIAIAAWMLVSSLIQGQDPWMGMKFAGYPFLGERALEPGFDSTAVLVGVLSHFAVSVVWGIGFGTLFYGLSRARTLAAGAVWGVVSWLVMFYAVLPFVGLGKAVEEVPIWMAIAEHVLFGVVVAFGFLPFQRRVIRQIPTYTPTPSIRPTQ